MTRTKARRMMTPASRDEKIARYAAFMVIASGLLIFANAMLDMNDSKSSPAPKSDNAESQNREIADFIATGVQVVTDRAHYHNF